MKNTWINHPVILQGTSINLVPLEENTLKNYIQPLLIKNSGHLFRQIARKEMFYKTYEFAISERTSGNQYPFVIIHKDTNKIIGSTRLFEIYPADKSLKLAGPGLQKTIGEQQ